MLNHDIVRVITLRAVLWHTLHGTWMLHNTFVSHVCLVHVHASCACGSYYRIMNIITKVTTRTQCDYTCNIIAVQHSPPSRYILLASVINRNRISCTICMLVAVHYDTATMYNIYYVQLQYSMLHFGIAKPQYVLLLLTSVADKKYMCRKRNRKKLSPG